MEMDVMSFNGLCEVRHSTERAKLYEQALIDRAVAHADGKDWKAVTKSLGPKKDVDQTGQQAFLQKFGGGI